MALADKDILITPNSGSSDSDARIDFVGADASGNDKITLVTSYDGTVTTISIEGSAGQLFSITNDLSGTLFAVNDVSGVPSLEIDADGTVTLAEFGGEVRIGAPFKDLNGNNLVIYDSAGSVIWGNA